MPSEAVGLGYAPLVHNRGRRDLHAAFADNEGARQLGTRNRTRDELGAHLVHGQLDIRDVVEGEIAQQIKKLPPVNREALLLRNVKNLSYEQIAELLDVKVGTIKSRIARAREELRRRLR